MADRKEDRTALCSITALFSTVFMRFREQQDITLSEMYADMMKSYESHGGVAELVLGLPYGAFSAVFVSLQTENKSNT